MNLQDFDFALPERLIAQQPPARRDGSKMMLVDRARGRWEHRSFTELPEILGPGDFLVVNTSRVFPARLRARRRVPNGHGRSTAGC